MTTARSTPSGARIEREDSVASSKRQTTMAKMARERKVQERRENKRAKKQAAKEAKAAEESLPAQETEDEASSAE
jgi:hypothetical protein